MGMPVSLGSSVVELSRSVPTVMSFHVHFALSIAIIN